MAKDKILSPEEALVAADRRIEKMPKNILKNYGPTVDKLKENGMKWDEIASFFVDEIGIEVKPYHIKTLWDERHPEKEAKKA